MPLEIRNEIYRNLLVYHRVSKRVPNPAYHNSPTESEPIVTRPDPKAIEIGKVGCQNIWIHTFDYHVSIMVTNRPIYAETKRLMRTENAWITVAVNKNGFGKDMKDHGFGVVSCRGLDHVTQAALKISIFFPSLRDQEHHTFLMSISG